MAEALVLVARGRCAICCGYPLTWCALTNLAAHVIQAEVRHSIDFFITEDYGNLRNAEMTSMLLLARSQKQAVCHAEGEVSGRR
jgi:hypothetical protein